MINDSVKVRLPIQRGLLELMLMENRNHFYNLNQEFLELLYRTIF